MVPGAERKVVLLKQLVATETTPLADDAARGERLEALLGGRRPELVREHDVDDPMGMDLGRYRRTVADLRDGIAHLADVICGPRPSAEPPT
jgi:protein-tyrosine-phosphatase